MIHRANVLRQSAALFSDCEQYRYSLVRRWGAGKCVAFIGLNPSTADESSDDPTIRRCIAFAAREGGGSLLMLNLFAFRTTDPHGLIGRPNPIGEPPEEIARRWATADLVICAWGNVDRRLRWRVSEVRDLLRARGSGMCLGKCADGSPRHPLYLRGDSPLMAWP